MEFAGIHCMTGASGVSGVGSGSGARDSGSGSEGSEKRNKNESSKRNKTDEDSLREVLLHTIEERNTEINELELKMKEMESHLKVANVRSDEVTEVMAEVMEERTRSLLISAEDACSPMSVAKRFRDIYDSEWRILMKCFADTEELCGIDLIFALVMECYAFCRREAAVQMACVLDTLALREKTDTAGLSVSQDRPDPDKEIMNQDKQDLLRIRRNIARSEQTICRIKEKCWEHMKMLSSVKEMSELNKESGNATSVMTFIHACAVPCWLMAITTPPMGLMTPDLNKELGSDLKDKFGTYSPQDDVEVEGLAKDVVVKVVWPAVSGADGTVYQKGEVVKTDSDMTRS